MSGQQEGRIGPDRPDSPDLLDSTLTMARLADRQQGQATGRHHNGLLPGDGPGHDDAPAEAHAATEAAAAAETLAAMEASRAPETPGPSAVGPPPGAEERAEPVSAERWPAGRPPSAVVGSPEPGSWADLRQRLERLPYGHPSSPYHVDGERKPPPPRLRHLELAPPVRAAAGRPAAPSEPPDPPPQTPIDAASHQGRVERHGGAAAAPLKPASSHPRPALPTAWPTGERDHADSVFAPRSRGEDASHRLQQAAPGDAERPAEHDFRQATVRGRHETLPRAAPHRDVAGPSGLPQVSRAPAVGRGRDAPRLAADGSWSWGPASLTRDQVRVGQDAYDRLRAAAGRGLFGGYDGGSGLTAVIRRIDEQLAYGSLAPGNDEHALLEPDIFRARFADLLRRHPDRTPEQLSRRVPGALSYVFVLEAEHYADGIRDIEEALGLQGFLLQARKNSWSSAANRCVFTIWHDPVNDLPFQVQFHTPASLEAQHLARTSAPLINDPRVPPTQAATIRSELAAAWAAVDAPPGNTGIGDYRRAGDNARG
jgi:hypothetical protein